MSIPRARSGNKALAGEQAGTTGAPGNPRPLWVATAPSAAVLAPGALPPVNSPGFCSPGKKARGEVLSWPAGPQGSRVAGWTSPCGPGKHSAESKRNHSHSHSLASVLQSLDPSKMSPALVLLRSPPCKKNQERGGNWVGGPQTRRLHPGAWIPTSAPGALPHPGKAPELAIRT